MSTVTSTPDPANVTPVTSWPMRVLSAFRRRSVRKDRAQESIWAFRFMSDHHLKALGLHRNDFNSLVYGRDAERVQYHEI